MIIEAAGGGDGQDHELHKGDDTYDHTDRSKSDHGRFLLSSRGGGVAERRRDRQHDGKRGDRTAGWRVAGGGWRCDGQHDGKQKK